MAQYQILYWQRIPTQVKVWDDFDEVKIEMPAGFMERVDSAAQRQNLSRMEDYLAQLHWSEIRQREGDPHDVARMIAQELERADGD